MTDETELTRLAHAVAEGWEREADDVDRLADEIADTFRPLAERAEKLEVMLRKCQWRGHNQVCPACRGGGKNPKTHRPGCELAALLSPEQPTAAEAKSMPHAGDIADALAELNRLRAELTERKAEKWSLLPILEAAQQIRELNVETNSGALGYAIANLCAAVAAWERKDGASGRRRNE